MKKRVAMPAILLGWLGVMLGAACVIYGLIALHSRRSEELFGNLVCALIGLAAGGLIAMLSGLVALWAGKRLHGACIGLAGVCLLAFAAFVVLYAAGQAPPVGSIPG